MILAIFLSLLYFQERHFLLLTLTLIWLFVHRYPIPSICPEGKQFLLSRASQFPMCHELFSPQLIRKIVLSRFRATIFLYMKNLREFLLEQGEDFCQFFVKTHYNGEWRCLCGSLEYSNYQQIDVLCDCNHVISGATIRLEQILLIPPIFQLVATY